MWSYIEGARGRMFGLSFYVCPYSVCDNSEGSCEIISKLKRTQRTILQNQVQTQTMLTHPDYLVV